MTEQQPKKEEKEEKKELIIAICWECGREMPCHEHIICCTGTMFHVCPDCLANKYG